MKIDHKIKIKLLAAAIITLSVVTLTGSGLYLDYFKRVEYMIYDWRTKYFREDITADDQVVIIMIDELSLQEMNPFVGRWPWPRYVYKDLLEFLQLGEAKAVMFDILFTQNEEAYNESEGSYLGESDSILVESTKTNGATYHAMQFYHQPEEGFDKSLLNLPLPENFIDKFSIKNVTRKVNDKAKNNVYYLPFKELYEASRGIGVVEFTSDFDGIYRSTPLLREYQGNIFPVLSMVSLLDHLETKSIIEEKDSITLNTKKGDIRIPLNEDGRYQVNHYKNINIIPMYSVLLSYEYFKNYGEFKEGLINPQELTDKFVFIGASAVGMEDLKKTPLGLTVPGVELHAAIISNILNLDFLTIKTKKESLVYIFFLSAIICSMVIFLVPIYQKIIFPGILFLVLFSWWVFQFKNNVVYDITAPTVGTFLSWIVSFTYYSFTEGKDKRRVKKMLSQYVSPMLLRTALEDTSEMLKAKVGSRENLTILFSDIRGFTTISEGKHAEEVVWILNEYLPKMVDVIFDYMGTLDKFIGDAIMAFWGAPVKIPDHAIKAVDSAIEMQKQLIILNNTIFKDKGIPPITMGVGVNTGPVILGNIGSEKKLDYTIIGDNVNFASRMEGTTKYYRIYTLITESTYKELDGKIPCRIIDQLRVKGKHKPAKIYEPLCKSDDEPAIIKKNAAIAEIAEKAFDLYLKKQWAESKDTYKKLSDTNPDDPLANLFISRCDEFNKTDPGEGWDGVYTMTTK